MVPRPPSTIIVMPRWNGNDLPPSPRNTHGGLDNGHVMLLYYFRMKFHMVVRLGDVPLNFVQIRRELELARYDVVHRYQHKIACTDVKYGGDL